jgi:hypothetical protein
MDSHEEHGSSQFVRTVGQVVKRKGKQLFERCEGIIPCPFDLRNPPICCVIGVHPAQSETQTRSTNENLR